MPGEVTLDTLKGFLDAFNRHDLDAIMAYFHDDCVFYMPRGKGPRGDRYVGKQHVRAGLSTRFEGISENPWIDPPNRSPPKDGDRGEHPAGRLRAGRRLSAIS